MIKETSPLDDLFIGGEEAKIMGITAEHERRIKELERKMCSKWGHGYRAGSIARGEALIELAKMVCMEYEIVLESDKPLTWFIRLIEQGNRKVVEQAEKCGDGDARKRGNKH